MTKVKSLCFRDELFQPRFRWRNTGAPAGALAKPDAFLAARFVSGTADSMLEFDLLPLEAVVVVVIHVSMLGRVLQLVRVKRSHFRHRMTSHSVIAPEWSARNQRLSIGNDVKKECLR